MKVQAVTVDLGALGALIVHMDSVEQGTFFKGMANEIRLQKSAYNVQTQFAYIRDELTKEEQEALENCLQMLWPL